MVDKMSYFQIQSFIVFDPSLSDNENEGVKKILYCHPGSIPICQQINTIGLCEAMCNFAREFTDSPCQFIHTTKTRIVLQKLESDIWMVLTVKVPEIDKRLSMKSLNDNIKKPDLDGYQDEDIQNSICGSIISHCGQMFFLFMGPPSLIVKNSNLESLKKKLSIFFDRYIGNGMLDCYHITDGLTGVHYLTVDEDMMLSAMNLLDNLQTKFCDIFSSVLLYNNNIVYSKVDKEDLGILYRYLITTLLAKYNINEAMNSDFTMTNLGRFVLVSHEPATGFKEINPPKIFFGTKNYLRGDKTSIRKCSVLVYKAVQATIVLFVDDSKIADDSFKSVVGSYLGPEITILVKSIMNKSDKIVADSPYKYIYWDPQSLAIKCTLFPTRQFKSDLAPLVPFDSMQLMSDIKVELDRDNCIREMAVKLHSESWVSVVKNNGQELFVAVNRKNISLIDVAKEVKLVCNREFTDVFNLIDE